MEKISLEWLCHSLCGLRVKSKRSQNEWISDKLINRLPVVEDGVFLVTKTLQQMTANADERIHLFSEGL